MTFGCGGSMDSSPNTIGIRIAGRMEGITRKINQVTYNSLVMLIQRVDELSPVGDTSYWKHKPPPGYVGGQFRGNWQLGVDVVPVGYLPGKIDPSGVSTVGENIAKIPERAAYGKKYYLVNNLPYAVPLENGHSRVQAPAGVVGIAALEYPQMIQAVAADIKANGGRVR